MLHQQDRDAALIADAPDEAIQIDHFPAAEAGSRLVQQQAGRLARQGTGQFQQALLAKGQVRCQLCCMSGQADQVQALHSPFASFPLLPHGPGNL